LHALPDVRSFLKTAEEMKYFLLVVLWERLFAVADNRNAMLRVLEVIRRGDYYEQIFTGWLRDLPADYVRTILRSLHGTLEALCKRLVEQEQTEQSNRTLGGLCQAVCYFLGLLYKSNKERPRVRIDEFKSEFLTKFFEPVEQF
jgi:hypothetical protein